MTSIDPIRSAHVRAATGSTRSLDREHRTGRIVRIRQGAYAPAGDWAAGDHRERMLAAVRATDAAARSTRPLFSHESAAAVHGIPVLGSWPRRARTIVHRDGAHTNRSVVRVRRWEPDDAATLVDGLRVTTPAVTAIDLAAGRSLLAGIVAMSHIRRHLGVSADDIRAELDRRGAFPGVRTARIALRRSTAESDSPLETLAMVRIEDLGFATPEQQFAVSLGTRVVLADFAWRSGRILGEADGRLKYRAGADEHGTTIAEEHWAEKRREDALRARCERFLRIDWADAWGGDGLERALLLAGVPRLRPRRPLTA